MDTSVGIIGFSSKAPDVWMQIKVQKVLQVTPLISSSFSVVDKNQPPVLNHTEWYVRLGDVEEISTNIKAGVGKKTSLRNKTAKKSGLSSKISQFKQDTTEDDDHHENPFLKLLKISKKEKQHNKSANFTQNLVNKVTFNTSNSASKSALRRQKRKERDQLKPKMDELLSSLQDVEGDKPTSAATTTTIKHKNRDVGYVKPSKLTLNQPNAAKATGHKQILKQENKNFTNVLKDPEFRLSPFSALKNAIKNNLQQ